MAEVIIPSGFGSAAVQWSITGRINPVSTTFGYSFNNGSGGPSAQDVASGIYDVLADGTDGACRAAQMASVWKFLGVQVAQNESGVMVGAYSDQGGVQGTASSTTQPIINAALVVQKRTPRIGRKFRGRMYWPPLSLSETQVSPVGLLDDLYVDAQEELFVDLLSGLEALSTPMYLLHSNADDEPTIVSSLSVASVVGTQRRRIR